MISKKTAKSKQPSRSKCATTRQRRGIGNKKTGAANLSKRETLEPTPASRKDSKQQLCLNLLCRAEGASIEDLQEVTGWQAHSVRGVLAGAVKRKLGMALVSEKAEGQPRRALSR